MLTWCFMTVVVAVASSLGHVQVKAAVCADLCYTTELTGFGPGGSAGCSCSGQQQGARAGAGSCSCGQCYTMSGNGIIGYAISPDGTCTFGTDCGDCDYLPDSILTTLSPTTSTSLLTPPSSSPLATEPPTSSAPPTDVTPPAAPAATSDTNTSTSSSTMTSDTNSGTSHNNADNTVGSASADTASSNNSLATWQIALIICCGVLVFTVAVVAVLSCYCKARNRLFENEDNQADVNYYQQQQSRYCQDAMGPNGAATPALFPGPPLSTCRSGTFSSLTNEGKPMYANSANSGSANRLMVGLDPVRSRDSSSDRAESSSSLVQEWKLSASYPTELRPSCGNRSLGRCPSFEPRYNTAREREFVAVDL